MLFSLIYTFDRYGNVTYQHLTLTRTRPFCNDPGQGGGGRNPPVRFETKGMVTRAILFCNDRQFQATQYIVRRRSATAGDPPKQDYVKLTSLLA